MRRHVRGSERSDGGLEESWGVLHVGQVCNRNDLLLWFGRLQESRNKTRSSQYTSFAGNGERDMALQGASFS